MAYYLETLLEKLNNGYSHTGNRRWAFINHCSHKFTLIDADEPHIKIYPKNIKEYTTYIEIKIEYYKNNPFYGTIIFIVKNTTTNEQTKEKWMKRRMSK